MEVRRLRRHRSTAIAYVPQQKEARVMTDEELIARHIRTKGVTLCEPGYAAGLSRMEAQTGIVSVPINPVPWRERVNRQIQAEKAKALAKRQLRVKGNASD